MRTSLWSVAVALAASESYGHGSPYVVFACRFLDAYGHPVSGLTLALEAEGPASESPIEDGEAQVALPFPRAFDGKLRLRVLDAKRRVIRMLPSGAGVRTPSGGSATEILSLFAYRYAPGTAFGPGTALPSGTASPAAHNWTESLPDDPLRQGAAVLGGDGKVHPEGADAPPFRLEWNPALIDSAEAGEAARAKAMDQGIDTELRARVAAIRAARRSE